MTHITLIPRKALLAAAVAVLGLFAWAALPSVAGAATCTKGNFCIWQHANKKGGFYYHHGVNRTLHNDRFNSTTLVADNGSTVQNNGYASGLKDVLAYQHINYAGPALCVPVGTTIWNLQTRSLPSDRDKGVTKATTEPDGTWNDDISSFRWVSNC